MLSGRSAIRRCAPRAGERVRQTLTGHPVQPHRRPGATEGAAMFSTQCVSHCSTMQFWPTPRSFPIPCGSFQHAHLPDDDRACLASRVPPVGSAIVSLADGDAAVPTSGCVLMRSMGLRWVASAAWPRRPSTPKRHGRCGSRRPTPTHRCGWLPATPPAESGRPSASSTPAGAPRGRHPREPSTSAPRTRQRSGVGRSVTQAGSTCRRGSVTPRLARVCHDHPINNGTFTLVVMVVVAVDDRQDAGPASWVQVHHGRELLNQGRTVL